MSSQVIPRVLLSVLAGALCGVVVTSGVLVAQGPDRVAVLRPPRPTTDPAPVARGQARAVLRAWDAARAAAWTSGDRRALAGLYTPGSVAGRRDVAMLRAWTDRGARVSEMTTQVLRLQVLDQGASRLVLVVTDRVARVRSAGLVLPSDRPSTRRIVLVGSGDGADPPWRVASVSPARPGRW
jgi:hypothetical protein